MGEDRVGRLEDWRIRGGLDVRWRIRGLRKAQGVWGAISAGRKPIYRSDAATAEACSAVITAYPKTTTV